MAKRENQLSAMIGEIKECIENYMNVENFRQVLVVCRRKLVPITAHSFLKNFFRCVWYFWFTLY